MANNSPPGADAMSALHDVVPSMTRGEHLDMAHAHLESVGAHAADAAAHLAAARDGEPGPDSDGDAGTDSTSDGGRVARPVSAQARSFGFAPGSGAARSLRTMTHGRRGG